MPFSTSEDSQFTGDIMSISVGVRQIGQILNNVLNIPQCAQAVYRQYPIMHWTESYL